MPKDATQTEVLIAQAQNGDSHACQQLLNVHREKLKRMVAVRLDPRLLARFDPSDVVQEAVIEAAGKLADYLKERPIPFYPWLRRLAWEHLLKLREKHLIAEKRSVLREEPLQPALSDESVAQLAKRFTASGANPSGNAVNKELRERVRNALARLKESDREILVLRYLEQNTTAEIAEILEIKEGAVKMRHRRALNRITQLLAPDLEDDSHGSN